MNLSLIIIIFIVINIIVIIIIIMNISIIITMYLFIKPLRESPYPRGTWRLDYWGWARIPATSRRNPTNPDKSGIPAESQRNPTNPDNIHAVLDVFMNVVTVDHHQQQYHHWGHDDYHARHPQLTMISSNISIQIMIITVRDIPNTAHAKKKTWWATTSARMSSWICFNHAVLDVFMTWCDTVLCERWYRQDGIYIYIYIYVYI